MIAPSALTSACFCVIAFPSWRQLWGRSSSISWKIGSSRTAPSVPVGYIWAGIMFPCTDGARRRCSALWHSICASSEDGGRRAEDRGSKTHSSREMAEQLKSRYRENEMSEKIASFKDLRVYKLAHLNFSRRSSKLQNDFPPKTATLRLIKSSGHRGQSELTLLKPGKSAAMSLIS